MNDYEPIKQQVFDTCQALLGRGYLKANEGNVSIRVPGTDTFAITPSGYDYTRLAPADICLLDLSGHQLAGTQPASTAKPSIEAGLHAAAYRHRPDVSVVIHTHQPYASALAIMRKPIPALFDEQARNLGRGVPVVRYGPSGTGLLRRNTESAIKRGGNAFILANHGVLVLGTDPEHAMHNVALLEKCSVSYLMSLMTGERTRRIPLVVREIAFGQLRKEEKQALAGAQVPAPAGEYAISEYPDVAGIYQRLDALLRQRPRPIRRDAMAGYLEYFEAKCHRSAQLTGEAKRYIPGGVQHNLAFNYPFPIAIDRAEGAYLWDADGNQYIDFLQAGGPTVLGSNYRPLQEQVIRVLQAAGPVTGLFHEYELKLAQLVNRFMPSVELLRMFGSGTEAAMAAIRAARAATGKRYIIKIGGAYHGWSDQLVYGLHVPGTRRLEAKGIPRPATSRTCEVHPNSVAGLRRKLAENRARGGTAAVIVEPLGPESGTRPVPFEFNSQVRELCDEFGALLIFDEVVTGFRVGMGGAQGYFGVRPDLTVFGKCIAGGYPMAGAVGGRADVMAAFSAGIGGAGERAYVGGTLSASPLSCAAGYYALLEMERTNAPVIAGRAGDRLRAGLEEIIAKYGLPFVAYNTGSIVHLETSGVMLLDVRHPVRLARELKPRRHMLEEMGAAYTASGVITLAGSRIYTSMADTDEVIGDALERFDLVLSTVGP
jgi:glutamate-1-semialdehyde 2,1-aminomutase